MHVILLSSAEFADALIEYAVKHDRFPQLGTVKQIVIRCDNFGDHHCRIEWEQVKLDDPPKGE